MIQDIIKDVLENYIGEFNNEKTRENVTYHLLSALSHEPNLLIKCDETNNPPEIVNESKLVVNTKDEMDDTVVQYTLYHNKNLNAHIMRVD